ncbi:MAG: shikimate dehydrogenase [Microscillaceae bacterium]|nr:shikimate dehydrogenase [Microscillaceae bacterium]
MHLLGLLGYPLGHSFSQKYFNQKFENEGLTNYKYELFELPQIELLPQLIASQPNLRGFNVTIPYKEKILTYLDELDTFAEKIKAVNVVKILSNGKKIGYNSDYYGFLQSLKNTNWNLTGKKALILGTGGSAKAVRVALQILGIEYQHVSTRYHNAQNLQYSHLNEEILADYQLIINTTPLGMHPHSNLCPAIPYQLLTPAHYCFDLVYNPEKTLFLQKAESQGAKIKNGLEMLYLQAEKSWEIWTQD